MSSSFCDCVNQWEQAVGLQVLEDTKYLSVRTRGGKGYPPSTIYKWPLSDLPRSTLCPFPSLSFTMNDLDFHHSLSEPDHCTDEGCAWCVCGILLIQQDCSFSSGHYSFSSCVGGAEVVHPIHYSDNGIEFLNKFYIDIYKPLLVNNKWRFWRQVSQFPISIWRDFLLLS